MTEVILFKRIRMEIAAHFGIFLQFNAGEFYRNAYF